MVPHSFAKRKHVRVVRRGTNVVFVFAFGAFGFAATTCASFASFATDAQTQANPRPAPTTTTSAPAPQPAPQTKAQSPAQPAPNPTPQAAPPARLRIPLATPVAPAQPVRPGTNPLPPAGKTPPLITAPPPLAKPFPLEADLPRSEGPRMELAGYRGGVFLRDSSDSIRVLVRGRLHLDFHSFFGAGHDELEPTSGGAGLEPTFLVRRARIEVGMDLWRRWFALFGLDFGSQSISNPIGGTELSAASPGQLPTAESGRYSPFQTPSPSATLANAYVDYTFLRQLHVMVGQHQAPFSLENRTGNNTTTWLERNMAIRSFVVPNSKEMGVAFWGDVNEVHTVGYEMGVFLGDGPNRPQIDGQADFIGRVFARPWARSGKPGPYDKIQVGLSFQRGTRDPKFVAYDYPSITTAFGWTLWNPRYVDSFGRNIHVLPSGGQTRFGGELRVPIGRFDLRTEAYWVNNGTREAVDGFQLKHSERFGNVQGVGYYAQVSFWPWGDAFVTPDPGFSRPPRLDLTKAPNTDQHGIEVAALFGGIDASYDGASRDGTYDANTPGRSGGRTSTINVHEIGVGATYWHSQFVRVSANYFAYHTVGSADGENLATVPGFWVPNPSSPARTSTWHHELGVRLGLVF